MAVAIFWLYNSEWPDNRLIKFKADMNDTVVIFFDDTNMDYYKVTNNSMGYP